jgi:hypothetical protein
MIVLKERPLVLSLELSILLFLSGSYLASLYHVLSLFFTYVDSSGILKGLASL